MPTAASVPAEFSATAVPNASPAKPSLGVSTAFRSHDDDVPDLPNTVTCPVLGRIPVCVELASRTLPLADRASAAPKWSSNSAPPMVSDVSDVHVVALME